MIRLRIGNVVFEISAHVFICVAMLVAPWMLTLLFQLNYGLVSELVLLLLFIWSAEVAR